MNIKLLILKVNDHQKNFFFEFWNSVNRTLYHRDSESLEFGIDKMMIFQYSEKFKIVINIFNYYVI